MKGKEKILGEVSILFMAYNLRKSISILGFSELLEHLKALLINIWTIIELRSIVGASILINYNGNMMRPESSGPKIRKYQVEYWR